MGHEVVVRAERPGDAPSIRDIHEASFPTAAEAILVDLLREMGHLPVSLVATVEDSVVGHVAFSPVHASFGAAGLGLAPVAVSPEWRRQGIASALVSAGLRACAAQGCSWVVVLGDPAFYARFGFSAASEFGLSDEYGGGIAFRVIELVEHACPHGGGTVRYGAEFAAL
jgi:putative acetyltransferase